MKHLLLFFVFFFLVNFLMANDGIEGEILNTDGNPLPGANIFWLETQKGTVSDSDGKFVITAPETLPAKLVISYVGYSPDTLLVEEKEGQLVINLKESVLLGGVDIRARNPSTFVSRQAAPVQVVSAAELQRAACCDLSGCFETNTSVQPSVTNVITSSKELRMLGLSGVYNYQLIDNQPLLSGLAYTYGLSSWPGTFVENIHISKGANSVLHGYEPITGEIDFETWSPDKAEPLLINFFVNSHLEHQANILGTLKKDNWQGLLGFHTARPGLKSDRNNDGFLDAALIERYAFFTKNTFSKNRLQWDINARFLTEDRMGGQLDFEHDEHFGTTDFYGQNINYNQAEMYSSLNLNLNDNHRLKFSAAGQYHIQESYFGLTTYDADQIMGFAEARHDYDWKSNHQTRYGLQMRYLEINKQIAFLDNVFDKTYAGDYRMQETVPGVFVEQQFNWLLDRLTLITGLRMDHHNHFGWNLTPRFLLRYAVLPELDIRLIAGSGWRTSKFFAENSVLLASHRDLPGHLNKLLPERAYNYGGQVIYHWEQSALAGYINFEYFFTDFQRMHVPDLDEPDVVGLPVSGIKASSGSFMVESSIAYEDVVEFKVGYVYQTTTRKDKDEERSFDLVPEHKLLTVVSYRPFEGKIGLDANLHVYGKQRLPAYAGDNGQTVSSPSFANPYSVVNFQLSWFGKKIDIYSGVENVFDFRQTDPILGYETPFSGRFDPSSIWGPIRGREIYLGLRWRPL